MDGAYRDWETLGNLFPVAVPVCFPVTKCFPVTIEAITVDALAVRGDERRGSLRKASGSRQTDFDTEISEWGNPPRIT